MESFVRALEAEHFHVDCSGGQNRVTFDPSDCLNSIEAEAATGNREFFWNKPHAIGGSRKAP